LQKGPVLDQHVLAGRILAEVDGQIGEINFADESAEGRHEDVAHQGRHYLAERRTDDHTHRQIDHIAFHRKFFEFRT
jgi:hypothetical protein